MNKKVPEGHLIHEGTHYVEKRLFDAACQHVLEIDHSRALLQITLNSKGEENKRLMNQLLYERGNRASLEKDMALCQQQLNEARQLLMQIARAI
ncbi:hypothetical protein CCP4SC76_5850014 [Gammaproteobacteria bacterium]